MSGFVLELTLLVLHATSSAVTSPHPLWNWMPSRMFQVNVDRSGARSQLSAIPGPTFPSAVHCNRVSHALKKYFSLAQLGTQNSGVPIGVPTVCNAAISVSSLMAGACDVSADIAVAVGAAVAAGAEVGVGGVGVGSPSPQAAMNATVATTTTAGIRSLAMVLSVNVNIALPPCG